MSSVVIQTVAIDQSEGRTRSPSRPRFRLVSDDGSQDTGVIRGVISRDALRLWRRWMGKRTILQLGCSPMVKGDPAVLWDLEMYEGMLVR